MPSQIDATKPVEGTPTTQSVRDNFTTAKSEISALQTATAQAPYVPIAGATLTGPLLLAGDPTSGRMAATRDYVDAHGTGGAGGIPEAPADTNTYGRHAGAWSPVLPLIGGTLAGALVLSADPAAALGAATKGYVDAATKPASENAPGIARLATVAQAAAGTDDATIVTPLKLRDTLAPYQMPPGAIIVYGGATAPSGWLICNGQAISRTTYAALFAVIGGYYGVGDGSTTFNLPDLRGRVPAGLDPGNATGRLTGAAAGGVSASALGGGGGEQAHALTTGEMPSHNHGVNDPTHSHAITDPQHTHPPVAGGTGIASFDMSTQWVLGAGQFASNVRANTTGYSPTGITINGSYTGITIAAAGGSGTHNVAQPTLIVNYLIKT